jgi:uncharacterized repeat protein (TIGR01451 family)
MKKILLSLIVIGGYLLNVTTVNAQYGQYGSPSPSQSIMIEKMVGKVAVSTTKGGVTTNNITYIDNLSPSDPRFHANDEIMFLLKITNTSSTTLSNVRVRDFVPAYLTPIQGPGNFDTTNRVVNFTVGDMPAGQEQDFYLKMKIADSNQMPADKGLFCEVNRAQAYNDQVSDESTSQFCIEKQVTGVITTPSAGPEFGLVLLAGEIATLAGGLMIKQKLARLYN